MNADHILMASSSSKIAVFIDGSNLHSTAKALGFDIDYKCLLKEFESSGTLVRVCYYTAIIESQEYSSVRPLLDWLNYNGFTVVTKATKEFVDDELRRQADVFCDIRELQSRIGRDRSERAPSRITRNQAPRLMQRAIARSSDDDEE